MGAVVAIGIVVGAAVLAAGGTHTTEVWLLALIAAIAFGDLARRARAEGSRGDPTDVWMSVAFAVLLSGAAWDVGRRTPAIGREAPTPLPSWERVPEGRVRVMAPPEAAVARTVAVRLVGTAVIFVGFALRQRAAHTLGEQFLVRLAVRDDHRLVDSGPYRWVRHPTYAGLLLVALGTALAFESPVALAVTLLVWLPITLARIEREERILASRFGAAYDAFRRRTWRLLPGLY
jgi:protein-S-isoprenylcysteine O-methyltransferase Ste14